MHTNNEPPIPVSLPRDASLPQAAVTQDRAAPLASTSSGASGLSLSPNLTPPEASAYLERVYGIRRKPSTLAKIRCLASDGPRFVTVGRSVLYPESSLREWAQSIISAPRRSTSEKAA